MKQSQLVINDLLLLFCKELPLFEIKVNRLNDLSEDEWLLFIDYVKAQARLTYLTPVGIMEAVDSIITEMENCQ